MILSHLSNSELIKTVEIDHAHNRVAVELAERLRKAEENIAENSHLIYSEDCLDEAIEDARAEWIESAGKKTEQQVREAMESLVVAIRGQL